MPDDRRGRTSRNAEQSLIRRSQSRSAGDRPRSLRSLQLAMRSLTVLDVPPRIRLLLIIAGMIGIGLIGMESLVGNRPETIPIDKIIHFSGYGVLACVFVLGLRPALFIPLLLTLVAMGMTIEFLQTLTGRQFDPADQYANTLGVAVGGAVGLLLRRGYACLRRELATAQVRRRLRVFPPGPHHLPPGRPRPSPVHHQDWPGSAHPRGRWRCSGPRRLRAW